MEEDQTTAQPISSKELARMDAYWRAANYLSVVLNDMDRFHLVMDVIDRVPSLGSNAVYLKQKMRDKLIEHSAYIIEHGQDMAEIRNWQWSG